MKKPYDDWVPNPDLWDSFDIVHAHKPLEQPPSPASYIIFKVGEKTYAKNCQTGHIEFSDPDAASVIQAAINATPRGRIFFKQATYNINSTLTIPTTAGLRLELVGEPGTVIEHTAGTIDSMLDALATSYTQGVNAQLIALENLWFKFKTKDANSIGLDLRYITPISLRRVTISNTNTTRQGKGITMGPPGNPSGCVWDNVSVSNFATNYDLGIDHLVGNFLFSENANSVHFNLAGNWITLIHPQAFLSAPNLTSAKRFTFHGWYQGQVLINPLVEGNANGARVIDYYAGYGYIVYIYNLICAASPSFTDPVIGAEDLPYVKFINCPSFVTANSGTATFSGDGTTKTFTIAHGLASTPTVVMLEAKSADAAGDKYWSADATNITVTFKTAPPAGTNNVVLSWKAEI